jgi:hypothetical protein
LLGLSLLAGLIVVVTHLGDLENFVRLVRRVAPAWLILALSLQLATYICVAAVWYLALLSAGVHYSLLALIPLGIAKLFSDQAMPSGGMSDTALILLALNRRGIPNNLCMATLLLSLVTYYGGAYLLAALATLILLYSHHAIYPWVVLVVIVFSLAAVGIPGSALWLQRLGQRDLPKFLQRMPGLNMLMKDIAGAPPGTAAQPRIDSPRYFLARIGLRAGCGNFIGHVTGSGRADIVLGGVSMLYAGLHGRYDRAHPIGPGQFRGHLCRHAGGDGGAHRGGADGNPAFAGVHPVVADAARHVAGAVGAALAGCISVQKYRDVGRADCSRGCGSHCRPAGYVWPPIPAMGVLDRERLVDDCRSFDRYLVLCSARCHTRPGRRTSAAGLCCSGRGRRDPVILDQENVTRGQSMRNVRPSMILCGVTFFLALLHSSMWPTVLAADDTTQVPQQYDRAWFVEQARQMAAQPYQPAEMPGLGELAHISYDQYREIRFRPEAAIWKGDHRGFALDLLHPGFYYKTPVQINLLEPGARRHHPACPPWRWRG